VRYWSRGDTLLLITLYVFVILFIIYPIGIVFLESLKVPNTNKLGLDNYVNFFSDPYYFKCFRNSVILGILTIISTTIIGFPLAYILARYRIRGKTIFTALTLLPILLPPYVGAFAFIIFFGKYGTLNLLLEEWGLISEPINFIYGLHGIVLVETIHLLPFIVLNVTAGITQIDPSFEEAAEVVGASGLWRALTVTIPLVVPNYMAGAFLVFIFTMADWLTPLILGQTDFLATIAYINIAYHFTDVQRKYMGIIATVLAASTCIAALLVARKYVEMKSYAALSKGTTYEGRVIPIGGIKKIIAYLYCIFISALVLISPFVITIAAFSRRWILTPFPEYWTFENIRMLFIELPMYIRNTFVFSGIALLMGVVVGLGVAYIVARSNMPGRDLLDSLFTMILAIPGIVVGVGYLIGYGSEIPLLGFSLARSWIVMPLALAVRRLPYFIRSAYASFLQLDKTLEEAAEVSGSSKLRVFFTISLPLIMRGVFAGMVMFFIMAMQEISSTIFLYKPGWETMPIGIFLQWHRGTEFGVPAALAFLMIIITFSLLMIISKLGQRVLGGAFSAA